MIRPRPARRGRPPIEVPLHRAGAVLPLLQLAREAGLDADALVVEAGLPPAAFGHPETPVPFRAICRLADLVQRRLGRDDVGLLAGARTTPQGMGPLGYLAVNASTVGAALDLVLTHLHLNNTSVIPHLRRDDGIAEFGMGLVEPGIPGADQYAYGAIAMAGMLLRALAGKDMRFREVHFAYRGPRDASAFRAYFAVPVRFDSDRNAILFEAEWLAHPVAGADPVLREMLEANLASMTALGNTLSLEDRVRRVMRMLLASDRCSEPEVARACGMDRRTLARRLRSEGATFRALHDQLRYDVAQSLLRDSATPIVDIADKLGYADASAFTRAFRRWSGTTPASWRRSLE